MPGGAITATLLSDIASGLASDMFAAAQTVAAVGTANTMHNPASANNTFLFLLIPVPRRLPDWAKIGVMEQPLVIGFDRRLINPMPGPGREFF
jgi:hypothetical protein